MFQVRHELEVSDHDQDHDSLHRHRHLLVTARRIAGLTVTFDDGTVTNALLSGRDSATPGHEGQQQETEAKPFVAVPVAGNAVAVKFMTQDDISDLA